MKCQRLLRVSASCLAVVASVCVLTGTAAASAGGSEVEVTPDVVYGHKYGMALTFDVLETR